MQKLKSDLNLLASGWLNEVPYMICLKSYQEFIEKTKIELDQQPKDKLDMSWNNYIAQIISKDPPSITIYILDHSFMIHYL